MHEKHNSGACAVILGNLAFVIDGVYQARRFFTCVALVFFPIHFCRQFLLRYLCLSPQRGLIRLSSLEGMLRRSPSGGMLRLSSSGGILWLSSSGGLLRLCRPSGGMLRQCSQRGLIRPSYPGGMI